MPGRGSPEREALLHLAPQPAREPPRIVPGGRDATAPPAAGQGNGPGRSAEEREAASAGRMHPLALAPRAAAEEGAVAEEMPAPLADTLAALLAEQAEGEQSAALMPAGSLPDLAREGDGARDYLAWSNIAWLADSHLLENGSLLPPGTRSMLAQMRDLAEAMRDQSRPSVVSPPPAPDAQKTAVPAGAAPASAPEETETGETGAAAADGEPAAAEAAPAFPGAAGVGAGTGRPRAPARRLPGIVAACAGVIALAAALREPLPAPAPEVTEAVVDVALAPSPSEPVLRQMLATRLHHATARADRIDPLLLEDATRLPPGLWPLDQLTVEAGLTRSHRTRVELQRRLARATGAALVADGLFGPETRRALRGWQGANGLLPTGHFDLATIGLLRARTDTPRSDRQGAIMLGDSRQDALCLDDRPDAAKTRDLLRCEETGALRAGGSWLSAALHPN